MAKDLTVSNVDRQNILNNQYAVEEIQKSIGIKGISFNGKSVFLKEDLAVFFDVTLRTINNYLANNEVEFGQNGYEVLRGKALSEFKLACIDQFGSETEFTSKTTVLGIFDFRAFLNLAMLITESDKAKLLRKAILDIMIDTINKRTGGGTRYINQRDEDFIISYYHQENYRKQFTDALKDYLDMGNVKYPMYTDKVYVSIFKENANEYRKILQLQHDENIRDTFYAEVLDLISAYECGIADKLKTESESKNRKLTSVEADALFKKFENQAHWKPLIEKARVKMASRDLAFRDVLHLQLKNYIHPINAEEFERFIGEKSKELSDRLEDAKDVMKRLKDRD